MESLERSPNTIKSYAGHLKLYWEFLQASHFDWGEVTLENLADFIHWLRQPNPKITSLVPVEARRTERTINTILSAICSFYEFQERIGLTDALDVYRYQFQPKRKYKSFLHHINKGKKVRTLLLKLKEPKKFPGCLSSEQVIQIINACNRIRDKFLICLLYETGLRIGEALGLRHEDIHSTGENEIHVVHRLDNYNGARVKSGAGRVIHVTKDLMKLYTDYLLNEYPEDIDSDYLFVNIWEGSKGNPMTYAAVDSLFRRLQKKTNIEIYPHLLRHTHATELIRSGWDMSYVQKRLGHADIQTTINTYVHLNNDDMKEAYQNYLENRDK